MGVPKFFRYISERYPCLSELIKADQVSDFDNLYLDMNGIIHMCSHPDDNNPHFRITEEKIFAEIFHYIAYLFQLIGPKKVFFMAVDGVAPRAKMNQQRGRRFRTAKDMQQQEQKARDAGEKLPEGKRFDSNCITPGTVFMARLQEQLRYFVKQKISTDSAWAKCRVVLSGHETPGEGEHKIMEYIRYLKAQPDHDPNTRHCLYGLDADLIMLGLCSHEPNFSLLREEVKFGKNIQRASSPDENNFFLLHLSLLRDYLEQEFLALKEDLDFEYDMEKIIDDWVLMGFLVGNDFIPPLPHLHIHNDALPLLFDIYKTVIKKLDGYINEGGILNLKRFEVFMKELANLDKENFQETYADLKFFEEKTGRKPNESERKSYKNVPDNNDTFGMSVEEIKAEGTKPISAFQSDLQALIKSTNDMAVDDEDDKEWDDFNTDDEEAEDSCDDSEDRQFNAEFILHKRDYYLNKLEYKKVTGDVLREQAECYVRAVQWVLHYYYQGCASWSWYYPHHYAPYISDVINFKDMDLTYEMAKPFKPFEQLLAVLPAASKDLLPAPFHFLMTNDSSPILTYYPLDFATDLNGKKNDWEAVVVIPFINETNLLEAMHPFYAQLSEDETKRNTHGPMHIYDFTPQDLGECRAPEYFPLVRSCHARETPVWLRDIAVPPEKVVRGPLPNPTRGLLYPGIPTLRHLDFKSHFTKARVKVFDFPSRNDNCILELKHDNSKEPDIRTVAGNLLGKVIWAGWPHLSQAKVVEVSNAETRFKYVAVEKEFSLIEDDEIFSMSEDKNPNLRQWDMQKRTIIEHNMSRLGIDVGDVSIIVHAKSLKGYQYIFGPNGKMITGAEWCEVSSPYPYQAVIYKMAVAPMYSTRSLSVEEALPKGDKVFIKTGPYYGCIAEIVDSSTVQKLGRVKICVFMEPEPVVQPSKYAPPPTQYLQSGAAAAKCGVTPLLLSRLTGCIFVSTSENPDIGGRQHRTNIGLNIKFTKKNEEVTGYTRRVDNRWLYSQKCIDLVNAYSNKYHEMFQCLAVRIEQDNFTEKDLFPNNVGDGKIKEITEWLKAQPYNRCSVRACDSQGLEPEQIEYVKDTIAHQQPQLESERKRLALQVKPHVLFKPELHLGTIPPDATAANFRLYDRVINVNPRSTVPLGLKGTVVAISQMQPRADTVKLSDKLNTEPVYQILFDKPFLGGINTDGIDENRIFKMQGFNLLNITQGRILYNKANDKVQVNLKASPSNTTPDSFKMLRTNDGHNSAFANYTSPTKNQMMTNDAGTSYTQQRAPTLHYPTPKMQTTVDDSYTQLLKSLLRISDTKNTVVQHQGPPQLDNFFQPNFNRPQGDNPLPPQGSQAPHFPPDNQNYLQMVHPNNTGHNPNFIPPMASDLPGFNKGNMQDNNGGRGIPSLHFYNTNARVPPVLPPVLPPPNLQLPFPQKLIEHDNNQNTKFNNGTQPKVLSNVSAPFIPLQAVTRQAVTRTSAPIGNKNYKKNFHENKVIPSATGPDIHKETRANVPPAIVQGSNATDNRAKPAPKKKKSRIAANFGLPQ